MMRRVLEGRGVDTDFQTIIERGDRKDKAALERLEREKRAELAHKERIYGDDIKAFDGVDNNGNLYKDISLSELI